MSGQRPQSRFGRLVKNPQQSVGGARGTALALLPVADALVRHGSLQRLIRTGPGGVRLAWRGPERLAGGAVHPGADRAFSYLGTTGQAEAYPAAFCLPSTPPLRRLIPHAAFQSTKSPPLSAPKHGQHGYACSQSLALEPGLKPDRRPEISTRRTAELVEGSGASRTASLGSRREPLGPAPRTGALQAPETHR